MCYLYDIIIIIIIIIINSSYSLPELTAYQGQHINGSYINRKSGITHKFSTRDSSKLNELSYRVGIRLVLQLNSHVHVGTGIIKLTPNELRVFDDFKLLFCCTGA